MVKSPTSDNENAQLITRLRPDTLGQVFGAMAVLGGGLFLFSFFSLFGYVILFNPSDGAPLPLPITFVGIGSWACITISLWSYVVWASWKLRNQPQDPGQTTRWNADEPNQSEQRPRRGFQVRWYTGNRDLYEQRQRWRFFALGLGVLALLAPVAIVVSSVGS